jgi:dTDP-4-amino-4,6-dideoxygalactose transaminase
MNEKPAIQIARPDTGEEEWLALREPLETGWLTQGPKVAAFERAFAERHGVKHAIATTSCTTALHLILAAMEIGPGDEVIVPAFTWVATANVVLYCGATPVFVDVDGATFNMDPAQIRAKLTPRTRAIIAVHLFGLCADVDAIAKAAPGVPIIEDAACAAGASYKARSAGSLGLAAAFSFHPRKSITTGEGGMVTTNDGRLAARATSLRNHGADIAEEARHMSPKPYVLADFNLLGFNYRMTDLQDAVGLVQLAKMDRYIEERQRWADFYAQELAGVGWLRLPHVPEGYRHGWQSYVCMVDEKAAGMAREEIMERLLQRGIHTRPGTHAVHLLSYYRKRFGLKPEDYPVARDCDKCSMAIPLHNRMSGDDYRRVVDALYALI